MDPWTETLQRAAQLAAQGELAQAAELHALHGQWQRQHGQLREAIASYERALGLCAEQPDIWVNLARARREAGRLDEALAAFRRAAALEPRAATLSLLSSALREAGRHTEALETARAALALDPECSEAYLNEGAALHTRGELTSAVCSHFVASLHPGTRERALHNLRVTLARPLPEDEGVAIVRRLLAAPEPAALLELGLFLARQHRYAAACVCLERALERQPSAAGFLALGVSAWQGGWHGRAEAAVLRALELAPADVRGYRLLGSWFCDGPLRPSERCLARFASCPDDPLALAQLGAAAQRLGRPLLALALYRRLAQLRPELVESHVYVGTALTELGEWREAVSAFERALALQPERWDVVSSLLFALHFAPEASAEQLFQRHRDFGERLARSVQSVHSNEPRPDEPRPDAPRALVTQWSRPLRIGYVSADLCAHPISYFLEPVLREHDRSAFEPICYSDVRRPDAITARLGQLAQLVPVHSLSHDELYARIVADGIDVLVDLAGHTAHNRLPVFARRPSPLQVSWLGYFDTTGLGAIDCRIADRWSVPEGGERYFVERVLRLPHSASCYQPPAPAAALEPARSGPIRFGCFNNPAKIGRDVCRLFAQLLHLVPGSELWLKYRSFHDPELCQRYRGWFTAEGIAPERVTVAGSSPMLEFLDALGQLDVALDPFPYSGETTALHTLWRGVPLVALEGALPVQRLGSRVLRVAGLHEWVASDQQRYLSIACELARDRTRLAALRRELPRRLAASPLLDQRGFTRELEAALQRLWREKHSPRGSP